MLTPEDRLYFVHIPKTAGTTLIALLDRHFAARDICPAQLWRELVTLPQEEIPRFRLFRGHFGANGLTPFLPEPPKMITMLRKPVPLALSTYRFIRRESGTRIHHLVRDNDLSFEKFIEHPECRPKISNKQTRHLSFDFEYDADTGPIFLSSESLAVVDRWVKEHRTPLRGPERLERAKAKLMECVFFGLVERFDESMALMSYTFGWSPPARVQRLMVAPGDDERKDLSPELERRILDINDQDSALYEFAERIFDERLEAMKRDLAARLPDVAVRADRNGAGECDLEAEELRLRLGLHYAERFRERNTPADRMRVTFDHAIEGDGWHRREHVLSDGSTFCWTGPGRVSTLDLPLRPGLDRRMTFRVVNVLAADILDDLRVFANGEPVDLTTIEGRGRVRVIQGLIPARIIDPDRPFTRLTFEVPRTVSGHSLNPANPDHREVGIAINWIDIAPCSAFAAGEVPLIEITPEEREKRRLHQKEAIVSGIKRRVANIPVVGPRLKEMYVRRRMKP